MFISVLLICTSLHVSSCDIVANTEDLYFSQQQCQNQTAIVVSKLVSSGVAVKPKCFKVGDSA
jgi:hypothetical protein